MSLRVNSRRIRRLSNPYAIWFQMSIKTRFAPSPTGFLHVGGARTALFSWLHARKHGGTFVLRIEDTDLERSTQESVDAILQGMEWLGLDYDEGPFYQTQRFDRYNEVIDELLSKGLAYRCSCSKERLDELREAQMARKEKPRYDGHCRHADVSADEPHVIRFKTPQEGSVIIDDMVRGKINIPNAELDDLIIRRTDGAPTYNLTVVVDDHDMDITHVIRGDDHINNTPRQIHLYQAMGWSLPRFGHVPMILGDDGARLSKRHGAVSVMQYKDDGYLPEGLRNYLVRLGWSYGDQEIFSTEEMIQLFDMEAVNKSPSAFNTEKLRWLNQQYIKTADLDRLGGLLAEHLAKRGVEEGDLSRLAAIADAQRERASTLEELAEISLFYFQDFDDYPAKQAKKAFKPEAVAVLNDIGERLQSVEWEREPIHAAMQATVDALEIGFGKLGMPLRLAVTGGNPAPDLDLTVKLIGREACLRRIERAVQIIQQANKEDGASE